MAWLQLPITACFAVGTTLPLLRQRSTAVKSFPNEVRSVYAQPSQSVTPAVISKAGLDLSKKPVHSPTMMTVGVAAMVFAGLQRSLSRRSRGAARARHILHCAAQNPPRVSPVQVASPGNNSIDVPPELKDVAVAGSDTVTPHWSQTKSLESQTGKGLKMEQLDWPNAHGVACVLSGVLFAFELVRFVMGQPPSDAEVYFGALIYSVIYASRFESIISLPPHFRVTFYATTGWTVYYIAHMLAATDPGIFAQSVIPAGFIFLATTVYFYKHWLERMYRHYVQDRFRVYYLPGLIGLMYFHGLDTIDLFNQLLDPQYWEHAAVNLPQQVWCIQDVRLTGLFMSSMALFMITLHNKGVLTGGTNTLITVLFTIFVPALFLTGTHATLQASFP